MSSLHIRLRIDFGDENAVGPGKIALLERMRDSGSLSQAARELKMSYRRAWQLLESLNLSFREPVVVTSIGGKGGGGSQLTPFGEELITSYREFETEMTARAQHHFRAAADRAATRRKTGKRPITKSRTRPSTRKRDRG